MLLRANTYILTIMFCLFSEFLTVYDISSREVWHARLGLAEDSRTTDSGYKCAQGGRG